MEAVMATRRVLTGMRTTGALHLGHYVGALKNWLVVQDSGEYDCYFLLADIQALTTHAGNPAMLTQSVREMVLDWLSVGLDPRRENVHFVLQSQIPERYELSVLLSMIARFSEVRRNPTLKAELKTQKDATVGFMAYPVDQVADIVMLSPNPPQAGDELLVPVGRDQASHLEYARELARRFNRMYGHPTLVPCEPLFGEIGRLVGTDGNKKMSKSQGNTIDLTDDRTTVDKKVYGMFTDPRRVRADIPGRTRTNPVFIYLRAFGYDQAEVAELGRRYRAGKVGDVEVKRVLARDLNSFLDPIRQRRAEAEQSANIRQILEEGTAAARRAAIPVIEQVRRLMHTTFPPDS